MGIELIRQYQRTNDNLKVHFSAQIGSTKLTGESQRCQSSAFCRFQLCPEKMSDQRESQAEICRVSTKSAPSI